jgi:hypothetical protein
LTPLRILYSGPFRIALAALLLSACRTGQRPRSNGETGDASKPADSLVISTDVGVEVWFTLARAAQGPDGKTCLERGLEIRRGETRVQVPLLYTGTPPVLLDDSTMRALLWNHCRPVDAYRVDLRSGRPLRENIRSRP